jgi:large subunit ribosomal protein L24
MPRTVAIRKGDEVQVIAGKDRGRRGRVVNVLPGDNRVMVEGVARATKHSRPTKRVTQGGIIQQEMFIDLSNVQIVCRACGRASRIGHRVEDGVKARICKRCGAET